MRLTAMRGIRTLWWQAGLIVLFNSALLAWLLIKPGSQALDTTVDDLAAVLAPLLVLPLCWRGLRRPGRRGAPAESAQDWASLLLGLGFVSQALGEAIWFRYEVLLHQPVPFPSWADAGYLGVYPCWLLGILLLPTRPVSATARIRIVVDGLLTMTAIVTFSWYFYLGPTLLQGGESLFVKIVSTGYPLGDLGLVVCLLLLAARTVDVALWGPVRLLALALVIWVVIDSIYGYQNVHGAYVSGEPLDMGWTLGEMLLGLGVGALRQALATQARPALPDDDVTGHPVRVPRLWQSLLPYAAVPAVGGLVVLTWIMRGDQQLEPGVYSGGALLVGLVILRQVFALRENHQLYRQIERQNVDLAAANSRLQALATTDPLTGLPNHRATVAALDHELARAYRYRRPCAVLFLDLDHFKAVNDTYGHPEGDAALCDFAAVVTATLRSVDTVGRWGGEEFVAVLPETDIERACEAAERVRAAVTAHVFAAGREIHLTCSIGVATYPADGEERNALIAAADHAMYAAKMLGRNQFRAAADRAVAALVKAGEAVSSREDTALMGTVEALAALVETRDRYTGAHAYEVAALARRLAMALGLETMEVRLIGLAARLHDVGKVGIPDAVLQKPGPLTEEEWRVMRTHPVVGADTVSRVPALRALAPLVRAHHERWDGRGYPDGLAGEAIPRGARIIAVADAYDAMASERPYRQASVAAWALGEVRRNAGTQFDPAVVAVLERIVALDQAPLARAAAVKRTS